MELFYGKGGHGGPYATMREARDAAIRLIAGNLPARPYGNNIQVRPDSTSDRVELWINSDDVEQLCRSYRDALDVQSACNLSGVVFSFEKAMKALCALGFDTQERNEHAISVLFAEQIAHLSKCEQGDRYHKAYEEAKKYERKTGGSNG